MPLGPFIRKMFGPFERQVSDLFRSVFINLDAFVDQIQQWLSATNIFELGCGEGAIAERLVKSFPNAHYTGIDIMPRVGRLFTGDSSRTTFKQQSIRDFTLNNVKNPFDLLIICDIMHHIPWDMHKDILIDARKVLKPGGYMILKDWERSATPIYFLGYFVDRYITGDHVRYKSAGELQELIEEVFGTNCIKAVARIRPWSNNIVFLVQVE